MRWQTLLMTVCLTLALPVKALDAYPQANLIDSKRMTLPAYRLVLSALKRNQAVTYGGQELRLKADVERKVWSLPEQVPFDELVSFYSTQFAGADVLYECRGLDCGSSNFWANDIFANARLVGREQNQFYQVARTAADKQGVTTLYVLYLVQRGSRQLMVNLDVVTTRDKVTVDGQVRDQIRQAMASSAGWLPGFVTQNGRLDETASQDLLTELKSLTPALKRRLYLVVQCYDASHMSDNLQCSERLAQQLRMATFDGEYELNVTGQGALTQAADDSLMPALRFVFWPGR
ncbi:DUF4892 domain-containing protein [Thalassolituus sp. LLYu03]|uniref:DUF4892 domain-containing protein n=1 Tax=Thalassolituus sp. LLYu03 TaxID=3421656 RepID=UPI003D291FDE